MTLQSVRRARKRDARHCRKCAFTNEAYVDPNMKSIFEFNNLRFSPEMFRHMSVIKDDCCQSARLKVSVKCVTLREYIDLLMSENNI